MVTNNAGYTVTGQQGGVSFDPRKLPLLANVPLLGVVGFTFFLPFADLSCGPLKARFTGLDLALGTQPTVAGVSRAEAARAAEDIRKEFKSTDPWLLLIPACSIAGIVFCLGAFKGAEPEPLGLVGMPAVLVGIFLVCLLVGFGIERDLAREQGDAPVILQKTAWFYIGFTASLLALGAALMRHVAPSVILSARLAPSEGRDSPRAWAPDPDRADPHASNAP